MHASLSSVSRCLLLLPCAFAWKARESAPGAKRASVTESEAGQLSLPAAPPVRCPSTTREGGIISLVRHLGFLAHALASLRSPPLVLLSRPNESALETLYHCVRLKGMTLYAYLGAASRTSLSSRLFLVSLLYSDAIETGSESHFSPSFRRDGALPWWLPRADAWAPSKPRRSGHTL